MRRLIGPESLAEELDERALARAYHFEPGVRASMVTSLDGIVTGADGLSGTLGGAADTAIHQLSRRAAEAIVVGAGTARAEAYGLLAPGQLLVVVSRAGILPDGLAAEARERADRGEDPGLALACPPGADWGRAVRILGEGRVWRLGSQGRAGSAVDHRAVLQRIREDGRIRILHEGGPQLLAAWLAEGLIDEICLTQVPLLLGSGVRLLPGPLVGPADDDQRRTPPAAALTDAPCGLELEPTLLLSQGGALFGRWRITARSRPGQSG